MSDFDRRDFLKLVGVGAGAAASTACSDHVEKLIPYVVQPEEITPGIPVIYASTCQECPVGCGLHVRTREARPIKLEGNPDHPINQGTLCARGQAGIGRTFLPDRFQGPMKRGSSGELEPTTWDEAVALLAAEMKKAPGKAQVLGGAPGATLDGLIDQFVAATGAGGRTVYEPFADEALREASSKVFGVASVPRFDLRGADLVIDFGNEVLETGLSPTEHARQLANARDVTQNEHGGARFVYVGARLSMTGSNADEWLTAQPGTEGILALALARAATDAGASAGVHGGLLAGVDLAAAATSTGVPADTLARLGKALASAGSAVALPPGVAVRSRRAVDAAAAVLVLNDVVGATGSRMTIPEPTGSAIERASYRDTLALVKAMEAGNVSVLLIHHSDPVYSLPQAAGFEAALSKVGLVVSFASAPDETTAHANLVLPDHTPLESWGDAAPRAGVRSLVQPTIRPLYDTRALGDTLLDVARAAGASVPAGSFRSVLEAAWADTDWSAALQKGGVFGAAPASEAIAQSAALEVIAPKLSGDGEYTLLAFPHPFHYDGRGASLPWLQEIPDNVTKIAWQSWAELSTATAEKLGLEVGDLVKIETSAGSVEVPVYPRGGIRDDVVAVPIGQGHTQAYYASLGVDGRPGEARGINVLDALQVGVDESGGRAWLTEKARLSAVGTTRRLPMLQFSDNKRGRMLGESISLVALAEAAHGDGHGDAHGGGHDDGGHHEILAAYDPANDSHVESDYRWGLEIDLDRCTGCSACVAACYVENNLPVVGEEETRKVRQMAWLRIERYVGEGFEEYGFGREHPAENTESLGENDIRHSPMMCQQCGAAPCEVVCPVIATYHNDDGLNGMIYNRCIGTRYCANNCPYKVRRYNYFDNQLTKWPEPMRLMLNPDVTVRGQGVMEKCTYCVQRIQSASQIAKDEGRMIREGEVMTACQQSCPSQAITFGNHKAEKPGITQEGQDPRAYHALHVLNTRPGTTYLAQVERGKVEKG